MLTPKDAANERRRQEGCAKKDDPKMPDKQSTG